MHTPRRDSRSMQAVMATDAFHHYGHGTSGARLLATLHPLDGADVTALARATGLHRTTVKRRLDKLMEDDLVVEADGLYYLAGRLTGADGAPIQADDEQLQQAAASRGTQGLGQRRRQRHQSERERYRLWLEHRERRQAQNRRPARPPL
ncbi:hypothetical protein C1I97_38605, partial [Streptomyces sp. NTH33]|uniref:helix-turn-helix domain-containing protein n=1 Tax=Streptomyces sp. NTH33 TaxID=1735453 RepID=UPI000DB81C95